GSASKSPELKRITIGVLYEPDLHQYGPTPSQTVRPLVNPGLTIVDDQGVRRPVLAEAVPSVENGLWRILPDGRMETTWTIRAGARWRDGVPVTVDDLMFALQVAREAPAFNTAALRAVEDVVASDPRTVTVRWKEPSIDADTLFSYESVTPLPRHRLEELYNQDKG